MTFYSFDTSCLINGQRDLLPPSIFPTLWARIEEMIAVGGIRCIDVVRDELNARDDDVHAWAKAQAGLYEPLSLDVQRSARTVLERHPKIINTGSGRSGADPFVIALAHARRGVVVTEETASGRIEKPKIPDVCDALEVPRLNLVGFIRAQGWVFH